jgi:hypothetical protein
MGRLDSQSLHSTYRHVVSESNSIERKELTHTVRPRPRAAL